jgi:uncharacterized protein
MAMGALFLFGRVAHIFGLYAPARTNPPLPRTIGVIITWLVMVVLIGWTLFLLATRN